MILEKLGSEIRRQREAKGLSQEALSTLTSIPRRTLTRLEAGDAAVRIGTYEKAAQALGLTLEMRQEQRRRPTLEELDDLYRDDDDAPRRERG